MSTTLILEHVYQHETDHPEKVFLTQPVGNGQVIEYSWGQVMDQARRMATPIDMEGRSLAAMP